MDKTQLRRHFRSLRECLPPGEAAAASTTLCHRLASWIPSIIHPTNQLITLTYLAFRNEPDLSLLFDLLPDIHWVVPRIDGKRLAIHPYDPAHLTHHRLGMLEPTPDLPVVDPATLTLVLVPGVAFDRRGGRLGFGGGYYDRFLPTTPALRVGVAYDACLTDDLPRSEHDQLMDWVVTPTREIYCAPLRRTECSPS